MSKYVLQIICLLALASIASTSDARTLRVTAVGNGYFQVYDPKDGSTVYVTNPQAYARKKASSTRVDGFGGQLNNREFVKGATPVEDTLNSAARTVNYATYTATDVAARVPGYRRVAIPARNLLFNRNKSQ